jgi:hypothetical protein
MPQPDSSRDFSLDRRWNETDAAWPVDPAAPRFGARRGGVAGPKSQDVRTQEVRPQKGRPKETPDQDGRTPYDPDGNEELEREQEEKPASRRTSSDGGDPASLSARHDIETEDTGEWVATQRFTLEDELEDTWPNVPTRYLDD